ESGNLSWKQFAIKAKSLLEEAHQEGNILALHRIHLQNLKDVEERFGMEVAQQTFSRVLRLASQIAQPQGLACSAYGSQIFIFSEAKESPRTLGRFRRLVERLGSEETTTSSRNGNLGATLSKNLEIVSVETSLPGETLDSLTQRT